MKKSVLRISEKAQSVILRNSLLTFVFSVLIGFNAWSQAPGCPSVEAGNDVTISCTASSSSTDLTASYFNLGETTDYTATSIAYAPPHAFSGLANPISVGTDDVWSPVVNLPFNFCFYGNNYNQCLISSNGAITFDLSTYSPGGYSAWWFNDSIPSSNLFLNAIFGPYHDMDPSLGGEVAWELVGTAPCRMLVVSFNEVPLYSCTSVTSTFQIVLYETTNVIEVYIQEKSACSGWNSGNTALGVQNATGTAGVVAPGRNTANWSVASSSPEAWRFTPAGADVTSITWFDAATGGNVIGTTDTVNVTPTTTNTYRTEVEYTMCDGSTHTESDTVTVNVDFCPTTIDFDGTDDYVSVDPLMGGISSASQMAWLNLDSTFSGKGYIVGQPNNNMFVKNNKRVVATIETTNGTFSTTSSDPVPTNQWNHVTSIYDGSTLKIYFNGEEQASTNATGTLVANSDDYNIGRDGVANTNYIKGSLQEVRVYDIALTETQLRAQIYQAIENNGGTVRGSEILQDINGLSWSNLKLYLKLDTAVTGTTPDNSVISNTARLNNMTTMQSLTAPIPYVANASGNWTSASTWEHGNVWDIAAVTNKDWAIVRVNNNAEVEMFNSRTHLGLIVESGSRLNVRSDEMLQNTSYLRLDGVIDLQGESQLIQTASSKLDAVSAGHIERDQQGKADIYSYNHWSSPVGAINTTTNNADFTVAGILRDGSNAANPQNINFVGGYDGAAGAPISIADFWIFKFANHPDDYNAWYDGHVKSTGAISVGEGYTQKGTGTSGSDQNYVFVGKPNNGVIQRNVDSDNLYLVGNPYPSALDANQFILDNITTTTGTLYFWEHWGGASHALADYQGGYATYNLTGATTAVPDPDVAQVGSGSVLPKQYVAVAQGFFVKGSATGGAIEFNNGQRAFQKESGGNSVFISTNASTPMAPSTPAANDIDRVYFRFTTPEGAERQLLLGVKEGLAEGFNNGYDGEMLYQQRTDCAWKIGNTPFVIQAIGELYDELELPLEIKMGSTGVAKFETEGLEDLPENVKVFFVDKVENTYTELNTGIQAEINVENGVHNDRYYVVFKVQEEVLAVEETVEAAEGTTVFYQASTQSINIVSNNTFKASGVTLYNVLGQQVMNFGSDFNNVQEVKLPVNVAAGTYVLRFTYDDKVTITKKMIIK